MAIDQGIYEVLKDDIGALEGLSEKKMFGGIAFMLRGNMLCGVHKDGAMYRVSKDNEEAALALPGARKMTFTGRPMGASMMPRMTRWPTMPPVPSFCVCLLISWAPCPPNSPNCECPAGQALALASNTAMKRASMSQEGLRHVRRDRVSPAVSGDPARD